MIALEDLKHVVGHRFPGGTFTIESYEHWLACDALLAPEMPEGTAHPMYAYLAAIRGMGQSFDELFALVGADPESGPLFGEASIDLMQPLRVGSTYEIDGEIVSLERKTGRRAGTFDIMTFRLNIRRPDGSVVAVSTNSFVFPRRS